MESSTELKESPHLARPARRLSMAEFNDVAQSLLANIEIILGPLWAWLAVAEVPSRSTLAGGAVLGVAIAIQAVLTLRDRG